MNMEVKRNLIAGQWVEGSGSRVNENPSDKNDPVGTFTSATADQVNDAVAAAKKASHAWARTSPQVRSDILDKAGTEILARKEELGKQLSREEGKTLPEGIGEATRAGQIFKWFAGEALRIHEPATRAELRERTEEMLGLVGFADPARTFSMYPFELSGGMRQRAMIAMALICRPALLIADEPTTALDVTIQAQILQLLRELQTKLNMAMLLITHDLGVVANVADEVVVIYRGEIMEAGTVDDILESRSAATW